MDRSFLSQPPVIAASRNFICVRLATYESEEEAAYLRSYAAGRSGQLENTVFCILSPDADDKLIRAARGARQRFSDAGAMAHSMNAIAQSYAPKSAPTPLPLVANVRLAIDVAAADNRPLVIIRATTDSERFAIEDRLARLSWSDEFIGRFVYAVANSPKDCADIEGADPKSKQIVVQSDKFGQKARAICQSADLDSAQVAALLQSALTTFAGGTHKSANHMREGQRQGVFWETQIPVTDPEEKNARERGRKK